MSKKKRSALRFDDLPPEAQRIITAIKALPEAVRLPLFRFLGVNHDWLLGRVMVETADIDNAGKELLRFMKTACLLKKMIDEMTPAVNAAWHGGNGRRKREENKYLLRSAIDALLDDGYLRSEIYEQMRLKYKGLMGGRKREHMTKESMWTSYKEAGGCHPKSIARRGRPKEK